MDRMKIIRFSIHTHSHTRIHTKAKNTIRLSPLETFSLVWRLQNGQNTLNDSGTWTDRCSQVERKMIESVLPFHNEQQINLTEFWHPPPSFFLLQRVARCPLPELRIENILELFIMNSENHTSRTLLQNPSYHRNYHHHIFI